MDTIRYVLDFQWAAGVPVTTVRWLFVAFFVLVFGFAMLQKRDYVYAGAPDRALWRDLRIWAALVLALQTALYLLL